MSRPVFVLCCVLLLGVCATAGFLASFSGFTGYDDEGLFLLGSKLFLGGQLPYVEVPWPYWPLQVVWAQLIHGALGVPVTHTAIRFVTLGIWLTLSALSGLLVCRLGASRGWAFAAAILTFLYTGSIVNEPGHPQGLLALLMVAVPLLPVVCGSRRRDWIFLGVLAAVTLFIKPNAGLFSLAAILVVLLSQGPGLRDNRFLALAALLGSLGFPFLLMHPLLSDGDCLAFATIAGLSAAATALAVRTRAVPEAVPRSAPARLVAGFTGVAALVLVYMLLRGIAPWKLVSSLLDYADAQRMFYHFFREYSPLQVALSCVSLCLAAAMWSRGRAGRDMGGPLQWARGWFVLATAYGFVVDDPAHAQALYGWAGPWSWVIAFGGGGRSPALGRLLLVATAAWSPLLAYPIPGSQLYFGTLPILLAAIVCGEDLCRDVSRRDVARGQRSLSTLAGGVPTIVFAVACAALVAQFWSALGQYREREALSLPGTRFIRVEPPRASQFRALVEAVSPADALLTTFRFSSLHLWSGVDLPGAGSLSQFPLRHASDESLTSLQAGLARARNPVVVDRADLRRRPVAAVDDWLAREFEPRRRIGPYIVMRRRTE